MNKTAELEPESTTQSVAETVVPLTHGAEAYTSPEYARAEQNKLWR
jgi:hypothetical protein